MTDIKTKARHERYRKAQRALGFKPRNLWLTDSEVAAVKVYIAEMRAPPKPAE